MRLDPGDQRGNAEAAMKVATIIQSKGDRVVTTRPDSKLGAVVARLKAEGIGAMVVSEDGVKIAGLVSERDIVHALAVHGDGVLDLPVAQVMTRSVVTCTPDDSVKHVMALMTRRRVRHLPVVQGGRFTAIISIGDVVKNRLDDLELEANVLRDAYIASH